MNRTTSIVFVALLTSSVLAVLPVDANHTTTGNLGYDGLQVGVGTKSGFVGLDRMPVQSQSDDDNLDGSVNTADIPEIYGPAAIGVIHVNDPAAANQAVITVTVTSSQDPAGEIISLLRDNTTAECAPPGSCNYYGTFGVEPGVVPNNGRVAVANNGLFTVKYGTEVSKSRLEWKPSSTAFIAFSSTAVSSAGQQVYRGTGVLGVVTVDDQDRNFLPGVRDTLLPSLSLKVTSESDPEGEWVQLNETDINTGVFQATFPFQLIGGADCMPTANGVAGQETPELDFKALCVRDGDMLTATYLDLLDEDGHPYITDGVNNVNPPTAATPRVATNSFWIQPHTGSIQFMESDYGRPFISPYINMATTPKGYVRYEDLDLAGQGVVVATVRSSIDTFGVPVNLIETTPSSGEFRGDFDFTTTGSSSSQPPTSRLAVFNGTGSGTAGAGHENSVIAYIQDPVNALGIQELVQSHAQTSDVVQFMSQGCAASITTTTAGTARADGSDAVKNITVCVNNAAAAGRTVHVFSARDLVGVRVDLDLAGAACGAFAVCGDVELERSTLGSTAVTGPSDMDSRGSREAPAGGIDAIMVRPGDILGALYETTTVTRNGIPGLVGDYVSVGSAPAQSNANVNVPAPAFAKGTINFTVAGFGTRVIGYVDAANNGIETGFIEIFDPNQNTITSGSGSSEQFKVYFGNGSAPLRWSPTGENLEPPGGNFNITVTETGANTAIFQGNFDIRAAPGGPRPRGVNVSAAGDIIYAGYAYIDNPDNCRGGDLTPIAASTCSDFGGIGTVVNSAQFHASNTSVRFRDQARESSILPPATPEECPLLPGQATNPEAYPKCYHGETTGYIYVPAIFRQPIDASSTVTTATATVRSTSDPNGIQVTLTERYMHGPESTGFGLPCQGLAETPRRVILSGTVAVHRTCDDAYLGQFTFTTGATNDALDQLKVTNGDAVELDFQTNADLRPDLKKDVAIWRSAQNASVGTQLTLYRGAIRDAPNDASRVLTVIDADRNLNSNQVDRINVTMSSDSDLVGVQVTLVETTPSSGIFQAGFNFGIDPTTTLASSSATDTIEVKDNDRVFFRYDERFNVAGEPVSRFHTVRWVEQNAGIPAFAAPVSTGVGSVAIIRVTECPTDTDTLPCFLANNTRPSLSIRDVLPIRVVSDSDGAGERILLTETTIDSGIYEGTVGFEQSISLGNGNVFVNNADRVTAYYIDHDWNQTQAGEAPKARIATTTWASTTNGPPVVTMTATPTSGLAPLQVTFTISASDPEGSIASYSLDFGDGSANVVAPGAPPNSAQHTYNAGAFLPTITVTDPLGATGSATVSITVTSPDVTPPGVPSALSVVAGNTTANSAKLRWTAPGDDGVTGNVSSYRVRVSTSSITSGNFDSLVNPANVTLTFIPVTPQVAGSTQELLVTGLDPSTTYNFAVRALDEANNVGAISAVVSATTTGSDTTPPTGTLVIASSTHPPGVNTTNNDPVFTWSGISDAESTITYRYVLNSVATFVVGATDGTASAGTTATFSDLAPGAYVLHVRGFSGGGASDTAHYAITVGGSTTTTPTVDVTAAEITEANLGIRVTVTRSGANNVISWTGPPTTPETLAGFQIWRSTSPFVLVADVPAGSAAFTSRSYTDPNAPANARYLVTAYYAKTQAAGYSTTGSTSDIAGFDALGAGSASPSSNTGSDTNGPGGGGGSDGVSPWVWLAVAIAAALLIALVVLAIVLPRRREAADEEAVAESDSGQSDDVEWGR